MENHPDLVLKKLFLNHMPSKEVREALDSFHSPLEFCEWYVKEETPSGDLVVVFCQQIPYGKGREPMPPIFHYPLTNFADKIPDIQTDFAEYLTGCHKYLKEQLLKTFRLMEEINNKATVAYVPRLWLKLFPLGCPSNQLGMTLFETPGGFKPRLETDPEFGRFIEFDLEWPKLED